MAELLQPFAGPDALDLAFALRGEFGSLSNALASPREQLLRIGEQFGEACELLLAARALIETAGGELLAGSPVDPRDPALLRYLRDTLCMRSSERLLAIYCNNEDQYILDEELGWGTAAAVRLDPVQLFRRAIKLDASSILLAHNHPSGNCMPSEPDINATRQLAKMGQTLGIKFLDHLIVTRKRTYSMRMGELI